MSTLSDTKLASSRAWKQRNKDHCREYQRKRNLKIQNDPELKKKKALQNSESWNRCRSKRIEYDKNRDPVKRALQSAASRKKCYAKRKEYDRNRDPVKLRARSRVRCRIYRGTLKRKPCEVCGEKQTQAHHKDYSKPLEVQWLCPKHHKGVHV